MERLKFKRKKFKILVLKIIFFVLGRALKGVSNFDKNVQNNILKFPRPFIIKLSLESEDINLYLKKEDNRLKPVKQSDYSDFTIYFKDIETAFKLMTTQKRLDYGFSENRMNIKGDLTNALIFTEILEYVQTYLYPVFIVKSAIKKIPKIKIVNKIIVRIYLYFISIPFGI